MAIFNSTIKSHMLQSDAYSLSNKGSGSISNSSYYSPRVLHTSTFRIPGIQHV